jgi:type II secretory pathway component PulM
MVRWYATHSTRDRRILLGVVVAALASAVFVGVIDPLRTYRRHVGEEITEGQEEIERSARFLGAADGLRAERDQLKKRLEDAKTRLLPGDSGTLGAAALQERVNAIATTRGVTVQSTQVMREEAADPFRKVSVRLTMSGELKPFAEFLSGLEYGPQQLTVPFAEVSRRGAVAGAKGPRMITATVEVSGYLRGSEKVAKPEGEPPTPDADADPEAAPGEGDGAAKPPPTPDAVDAKAAGGDAPPPPPPAGAPAPGLPPVPPTTIAVPDAPPPPPGAAAPGAAPAPAPAPPPAQVLPPTAIAPPAAVLPPPAVPPVPQEGLD